MRLSFRYQFVLAPFIVVGLLACLVAYTLVELSKINAENEISRHWEILTDNIKIAIVSVNRLNKVINELSEKQDLQQDEQFFSYLEQASILSGILSDTNLLAQIPTELRQLFNSSEILLREPERIDPVEIKQSINELLPALEYRYKIFAAQRRTAFINNHRRLLAISSRMTTVLLSGLILCITLATGLTLWGLSVTRRRLNQLSQGAYPICVDGDPQKNISNTVNDELDDLEISLAKMNARLLNVVSMENVLRGAENERRRIAMDMHDGVLADLTAINRKLDSLHDEAVNGESNLLRQDVDNIISSLRCTIDDLHPQILETLGLEPAIYSFLERHSSIDGFPEYHFEFAQQLEENLADEHKLGLFRIIIEAINNVVKHAKCDRLEVCARVVSQQMIVTVEDNGIGFENNIKDGHQNGHGCANISERAHLIGANVQWRTSRFSSGTCFELTMNVKS